MVNYELLSLLEKVLGKGKRTTGDNYSFFSPFIKHYKPKLEIDLSISSKYGNRWHCWVSDTKGGSIRALFKKMHVDRTFRDSLDIIEQNTKRKRGILPSIGGDSTEISLPSEFISLVDIKNTTDRYVKIQLRGALAYLRGRGITPIDIIRYNIGYCVTGEYSGMVVIPSYDSNFKLNFFTARTIYEDSKIKFKNPKVSKDIVGFESMINWNMPITITEGAFDAISARNNAIPLFGKTMSPTLRTRILLNRPPMVYIALDSDAIDSSIKFAQYIIKNNVRCSIVELGGKDVNEIGFDSFSMAKKLSPPMDEYDIIKRKVILI